MIEIKKINESNFEFNGTVYPTGYKALVSQNETVDIITTSKGYDLVDDIDPKEFSIYDENGNEIVPINSDLNTVLTAINDIVNFKKAGGTASSTDTTARNSATAAQATADSADALAKLNETKIDGVLLEAPADGNTLKKLDDKIKAIPPQAPETQTTLTYDDTNYRVTYKGEDGVDKILDLSGLKDAVSAGIESVVLDANDDLVFTFVTASGKAPITVPLDKFIDGSAFNAVDLIGTVITLTDITGTSKQVNLTTLFNAKENTANKATDFTVVDDVKFPTVQAVKTELDKINQLPEPTSALMILKAINNNGTLEWQERPDLQGVSGVYAQTNIFNQTNLRALIKISLDNGVQYFAGFKNFSSSIGDIATNVDIETKAFDGESLNWVVINTSSDSGNIGTSLTYNVSTGAVSGTGAYGVTDNSSITFPDGLYLTLIVRSSTGGYTLRIFQMSKEEVQAASLTNPNDGLAGGITGAETDATKFTNYTEIFTTALTA